MVFAQFSSKVVWFIGILMVFPECGVLFSFYSGSSQVCLGVHHPAPHLSTVKSWTIWIDSCLELIVCKLKNSDLYNKFLSRAPPCGHDAISTLPSGYRFRQHSITFLHVQFCKYEYSAQFIWTLMYPAF